jgi:small subunit ribosomal protein S9
MTPDQDALTISRQKPLWCTGRRKRATARIRVVPGEGRLVVNNKSLDEFLGGNDRHRASVMAPFKLSKALDSYDVFVSTMGGGITGQAEAIRLGISRALVAMDPALRTVLRTHGFLTRDSRKVERKKAGQPKARRRFQHSKR